MRHTLIPISLIVFASALLLPTGQGPDASVLSGRFGGYENSLCYGEGAGKAAPAVPAVYEALIVCQGPAASRLGPLVRTPGPAVTDKLVPAGIKLPKQCRIEMIQVACSAQPAPVAPAATAATIEKKSYSWVASGMADPCEYHDTGSSEGSSAPAAAKCSEASVGKLAVCWDAAVPDRYSPGKVWCTYKDSSCEMGHGGKSPGRTYRCTAN